VNDAFKAEQYKENSSMQSEWVGTFFFDRVSIPETARILDLGCGDGQLTRKLASKARNQSIVLGIDVSPNMIDHAKAQHTSETQELLQFAVGDASDPNLYTKLLLQYGKFDLIVSFHCLHWVSDHLSMLQNLKMCLAGNSKAYLLFASDGPLTIKDAADLVAASPEWKAFFTEFTDPLQRFNKEKYSGLIKQAGYDVVSIQDVTKIYELTQQEVLQNARSWLAHIRHLSKEHHAKFLEDLLGKVINIARKTDQHVLIEESNLEIEVRPCAI